MRKRKRKAVKERKRERGVIVNKKKNQKKTTY